MLVTKLKRQLSGQFFRNVSWLAAAEFLGRVCGLATKVTLAHLLTAYDYGLIAIVFTTIEFANVFTLRGGIGGKLVQADEKDLEVLTNTAYWLNWIICISIFVAQCLAAFPISWFYRNDQVVLPICFVALNYLIIPIFMVNSSLIQRENRIKLIAIANFTAAIVGSVLVICLALLKLGMWAVVLPSPLSNSVWLIIYLRNHRWRPSGGFTLERWQEIFNFAKNVVGVELLDKLRANLDYLLIGRFLGLEALGVYYFAFNAGLGISLQVIGIFWTALLPHLCAARENVKLLRERYFSSLKTIALIAVPLILLQSSLAPFYVPIIFGQKWVDAGAVTILVLICLSALPRPFALAAGQLLIVADKSHLDLYWNVIFTFIFAVCLLVAVKSGIYWVAASVLIVHLVALPLFTIWATRYVLGKSLFSLSAQKL